MIVKNEEHIVREVLESTLPLIDTYCIVDTGSSDNTIGCIRSFYSDKNIQGEIHEREWKNFGHNRSEALSLCDGKMDYALVMDADDLIEWNGNGKEQLHSVLKYLPNAVMIPIQLGTLSYSRLQIFKTNDDWRYVGVLHEYPTNSKQNRIDSLSNFTIKARCVGDRSKNPDKMKCDIETLLIGLESEPTNDRYMFYLAQSYRDDGQADKAIEWYKKRYNVGGWAEERYVSAYNVAKLTNDKEWAWKAHECDPSRIESLVSYLSYCRANNHFTREVFAMAIYASTIKKPTTTKLFLENDAYDWKIWDELSIIAYYCGEKEISRSACDILLTEGKIPSHHLDRVRKNRSFVS